jgi:uncharacterized oxidoreductase
MQTNNNTIFITGGATGIGFALAEKFSKNGNTVIICGRRNDKLVEARKKCPELHIRATDINNPKDRLELKQWIISNFPDFNILVNNAGIQNKFFIQQENTVEAITTEVMTNLISPIHLTNLLVPYLAKQKEAAIINISSGLAFIPVAVMPVYCATKAALHSFTISTRHQLKDTSIKVFEIAPPIVETELGHDGSRKEGNLEGITPVQVADETFDAMEKNRFEFAIGMALNLYQAAHSDKSEFVFNRINQ